MSVLGAYLHWEITLDQSNGTNGLVSAYVEFEPLTSPHELTKFNQRAAIINSPGSGVSIHPDEVALLAALVNSGKLVLSGFIEVDESSLISATNGGTADPKDLLPPAAAQFISKVLFFGSRYNVAPPPSSLDTPSGGRDLQPPNSSSPPISAVIDDGLGFLNRRFCRPLDPGSFGSRWQSRFAAIWLQDRAGDGAVLEKQVPLGDPAPSIDKMLNSYDSEALEVEIYKPAFQALGVYDSPSHRSTAQSLSHGTHLCDLACGAEPVNGADPMRNVSILGVQVPPQSIADTSGRRLEVDILRAVRWVVFRALHLCEDAGRRLSLVINLSLGISAGEKTGHGFLETYLLEQLELYQLATAASAGDASTGAKVDLVLAFGNDRRSRQVMDVLFGATGGVRALYWQLLPDDRAANYLEIRPDRGELHFEIAPPGAPTVKINTPLPAGKSVDILRTDGKLVGRLYREPDFLSQIGSTSLPPRPLYILATAPTGGYADLGTGNAVAPSGRWTITLKTTSAAAASVQAQRGDSPVGYRRHGRQSWLYDTNSYGFDPRTRNWELPSPNAAAAVRVARSSTHSSIAAMLSPDNAGARVFRVGATIMDKNTVASATQVALYSGRGAQPGAPVMTRVLAPDVSADGDDSRVLPGVLAAGTFSGSARRLAGTSVSAPQVARALIEEHMGVPSTTVGVASNSDSLGGNNYQLTGRGRRDPKLLLD